MKTYLIDEEVLRQVLDALERGVDIASDRNVERNLHIPIVNAFENLRTILSSPPAETDRMKMTKEHYLEWLKSPY